MTYSDLDMFDELDQSAAASFITDGGADTSVMAEAVSVGGHANGDGAASSSGADMTEKDPRKIARKYQLELCKKGMEENIIVYLGTGCGKTHIAALLIYELGHLIRKPSKNKCVFLAPTVALVQQQAKVIEKSIDFKVGTFHGGSNHLKTHKDWEKEIEQYEVLVMIPQVLLRCLSHCYIKMEAIALLIFDECHHAQIKSNHPYATIMKDFYKPDITRVPRIYGMTASPVVGKGASSEANLPKSINSLENILDAKVYTVEDKDELERFVASPIVRVYPYNSAINSTSSVYRTHLNKLAEIKRECISTLSKETNDLPKVQNNKKLLRRLHDNILFCLENLGLWGALQASKMLLSGDQSIRHELIETEGNYIDDSLTRFVSQAAQVFAFDIGTEGNIADLSRVEVLKEPLFSEKFLRLIGILPTSRAQPNMKCIIFVNRIVIARALSHILQKLEFLASWNCHFLVGVNAGLKSMSRKTMKSILEKFRSGELNLLVATKVGEEGLDIQTCCLVIRFDLPDTVASFIQSRGRARMPQSEYAFLVNSGSQRELDLIERLKKEENRMNVEIAIRSSNEIFTAAEERMYKVATTGACISAGYSISLLHLYCSKLPHDEFFVPKPKYYFFDDLGGTICNIILPSNAPIYQIFGTPQSSLEAAKKDACLKAVEELHKIGVLNDYLLPKQEDADEEESASSSDDLDSEGEGSGELHEMVVPAALKKRWNRSENPVQLKCYYIRFIPIPKDRDYKKFGLFIKLPLPEEVQKMELDLHLARGRSVMTKLVPFGDAKFTNNEVVQAEHFQEMYFKIILERSEFISESVLLGKDDCSVSRSSTFYLLLPLIFYKDANRVSVDWTVIRRCLSSPIFGISARDIYGHYVPSDMHLQLNNGFWSRGDVESSLVYATHNKLFYFVTNILPEKNGYSPCKSSNSLSHVEHFMNVYNIHLKHPEQPLLKAKPLFNLHNLLCNRKQEDSESHELDEFFLELPPEVCAMKIVGFSKDIGSSLSLLPSFMHRLENLLVAVELKHIFSASFPEGAGISPERVLEALTTEKCQERLSLERLEILGDSFLKFAVGRHLFLSHENLDEGGLTQKRSNAVDNSNLLRLATMKNLQVYIRDQPFEPSQFFALGRRCPKICTKETARSIHYQCDGSESNKTKIIKVRCSEGHHWLLKKTIADAVEALVGAFIVDCGFSAATEFLKWIGIQVDVEASLVVHACMASKNYLPLAASIDVARLEELLEYQFLHRGLLLQGFVHPSYNRHGGGCYQRLEFLGDAVLDYLITSYLFSAYPKLKPGQLTDLRSVLVNNRAFAGVAVDRSLHKFLMCDSSNLSEAINNYVDHMKNSSSVMQQFEGPRCPKALGDLVESCFGAILLDTGFNLETVWRIMLSVLNPMMSFSSLEINPIRELTELCQFHGMLLEFPSIKKGGKFLVEAKVTKNGNDRDICFAVTTMDVSKKEATRICAQKLLVNLKAAGYRSPMSTSLEEVLKSSSKMEPRLIGYDETPIDVSGSIQLKNLKLTENFGNQSSPNTVFGSKETDTSSPSIFPLGKRFPLAVEDTTYNAASQMNTAPQMPGVELQKTARARLYEICAANCWKPPIFDSYHKHGQSHLKLFTSRVTVVIEDSPAQIVECFGAAQTRKKAAAEHAAEAALWYLEQQGYLRKGS